MTDTPDNSQLLRLSYPDIMQHINKDGFITETNKGFSAIPDNDIILVTEFIRAFLMPSDTVLQGTNTEHLHGYIHCWYNITLQQPVKVCRGAVAVAMCRAGFTAYYSPGAPDCLYNIRRQDLQAIGSALNNITGGTVTYQA